MRPRAWQAPCEEAGQPKSSQRRSGCEPAQAGWVWQGKESLSDGVIAPARGCGLFLTIIACVAPFFLLFVGASTWRTDEEERLPAIFEFSVLTLVTQHCRANKLCLYQGNDGRNSL